MPNSVLKYPAQINALTSIRYLAATWVVFFHMKEFTGSPLLRHAAVLDFGYLGVDFFFILSGFVLTHVYKKQVDTGRFDYWSFIAKRLGRIYPMHILTLVLFLILGAVSTKLGLSYDMWDPGWAFTHMDQGLFLRSLVAHLTLIHAWGATVNLFFNLPSWSISAEWFAYLLFPVYMLLFRAIRLPALGKLIGVSLLFLVMAAAAAVVAKNELTRMSWNIGIVRIFPEFMLGVALYLVGSNWSAGKTGSWIALSCSVLVALIAVTIGSLDSRFGPGAAAVTVLSLGAVVLFAADGDRYGAFPLLSHPFFVLLGEISYSVYMWHLLIGICLFELLLPGLRPTGGLAATVMILGSLILTTAVSWISYYLVEIPGRTAIVAAARRLSQPPVPPGSA